MSKEELEACKLPELREKAAELKIDASGLRKAEIYRRHLRSRMHLRGLPGGGGHPGYPARWLWLLAHQGYLPSEHDVYVGLSTIRRNGLRKGDMVAGQTRPAREGEKFAAIQKVTSVNGTPIDDISSRPKFSDRRPSFPMSALPWNTARIP